jgi:hypothetical protein
VARMIPPYISPDIKSSGEKLIFDLFRNDPLTDNWIVLHSLCLAKHARRLYGEVDFLILAPGLGIFCLEVKSGNLKREEGVWKFKNKFGEITTSSRGPFQQAQEGMFTLMAAIKEKFGEHSRFNRLIYGYGVMFPHITFQVNGLEYQRWQVYDRDTRRQPISTYVTQIARHTREKVSKCVWFHEVESLPKKSDTEALLSFLRGDFERIVRPQDALSDLEKQIDQYTSEQYLCLDQLQENPRCLFQGAAGTGKTMIALESVRRGLFQKKRILMICFNRLLGKWLSLQFPKNDDKNNFIVGSFHSFLARITSSSLDYQPSGQSSEEFLRFTLPLKALEAVDQGTIEPFDKVVIDEGQDLIVPEYLDVFDALLKGGLPGGNWEIYADLERQAIYKRASVSEMLSQLESRTTFVRFKLTVNCRNTKAIGEETAILSGFETPPSVKSEIEGPPVSYFFYSDFNDQLKKLESIVIDLLRQGIKSGNISILSPRRWENSCISKLNQTKLYKSYKTTVEELSYRAEMLVLNDLFGGGGNLSFSTIQSFKGLENSYIILTDISKINDDEFRSILYVGMSRARIGLFVLIDERARNEYKDLIKRGLGKNEKPAN